jgi:hypothetical protein
MNDTKNQPIKHQTLPGEGNQHQDPKKQTANDPQKQNDPKHQDKGQHKKEEQPTR